MAQKINKKNLKRLCWKRGLSVTELAKQIRRSRNAVYMAAENPARYSETHRRITEVLAA